MLITPIGHAGFLVETRDFVIAMDPWMSEKGAYDSAWFQLPLNHHLKDLVLGKMRQKQKPRYLYVSHEHKDHMDIDFLPLLKGEDISILIADFENNFLARQLTQLGLDHYKKIAHLQEVGFPGGGFIKFFIEESGINRDSGVLIHADQSNFLNFNDAKLFDSIPDLPKNIGPIDVFSVQFAGGTWHPICYEYEPSHYAELTRTKRINKFESVARLIEKIHPRLYLPAAGPPFCLDPELQKLNFKPEPVFPLASEFLAFLRKRLQNLDIQFFESAPGDEIDASRLSIKRGPSAPVTRTELPEYVARHATRFEGLFRDLKNFPKNSYDETFKDLIAELKKKLEPLTLSSEITVPFYLAFEEQPSRFAKVDFQKRVVSEVEGLDSKEFYAFWAPAWQLRRVLDNYLTWEDLCVTYRPRVKRNPDQYNTILNAFLWLPPEDLPWFCDKMKRLRSKTDRIAVSSKNCHYEIDRFCPHQGADLKEAWINEEGHLVCPRHRWQFNLKNGGKCIANEATLNAHVQVSAE